LGNADWGINSSSIKNPKSEIRNLQGECGMRSADWGMRNYSSSIKNPKSTIRNPKFDLPFRGGLLVTLLKLPLVFTALACSALGSFIMIKLAFFDASQSLL
jgi:hypothetical protein